MANDSKQFPHQLSSIYPSPSHLVAFLTDTVAFTFQPASLTPHPAVSHLHDYASGTQQKTHNPSIGNMEGAM